MPWKYSRSRFVFSKKMQLIRISPQTSNQIMIGPEKNKAINSQKQSSYYIPFSTVKSVWVNTKGILGYICSHVWSVRTYTRPFLQACGGLLLFVHQLHAIIRGGLAGSVDREKKDEKRWVHICTHSVEVRFYFFVAMRAMELEVADVFGWNTK